MPGSVACYSGTRRDRRAPFRYKAADCRPAADAWTAPTGAPPVEAPAPGNPTRLDCPHIHHHNSGHASVTYSIGWRSPGDPLELRLQPAAADQGLSPELSAASDGLLRLWRARPHRCHPRHVGQGAADADAGRARRHRRLAQPCRGPSRWFSASWSTACRSSVRSGAPTSSSARRSPPPA